MSEEKQTKENKEIKISLKTVLLIVMALILIIVFLIYLYFNEVKKLNGTTTTTNSTETVKMTNFNEEDAINLLSQYLEERSLAYANPQALLEKYSYATNQEFAKFEKTADEKFIRTTIMYEDIRNEMQKYITKDFFTKQFKNIYKNSNGVTHVAILNVSKEEYNITRYELQESKTKKIINVWYTTTKDGATSAEKNMKVEFSEVNKTWIISDIK